MYYNTREEDTMELVGNDNNSQKDRRIQSNKNNSQNNNTNNMSSNLNVKRRLAGSITSSFYSVPSSYSSSPYNQHHHQRHGSSLRGRHSWLWLLLILHCFPAISVVNGAEEDCPWYGNPRVPAIIKTNCLCARNRTAYNQLSVQCHEVEGAQLVSILTGSRAGLTDPLELLYLNGSQVTDPNGQLPIRLFRDLKFVSLQLSACGIKSVHPEAFRGQESHLRHLSLAQNQLTEVPTASLERLAQLVLLDLSYNKITKIPPNAFEALNKLSTLKLNDNNLDLDTQAFKGLENSLRNLNLKATRISTIPEAISNLSSLAFLDLAQNRLRDLEALPLLNLHSLTVLNLERNLLQSLHESVFSGVNDTLSSLSLLNNLITHFPKEALHTLKELRVLDLGFNLLTEVPTDAFTGLNSLTLLALDGNPLSTLPLTSFLPLKNTLRGLSLGGRFLSCDCRIRWVHAWIHEFDLQVTSRERNPQFCGSPQNLRQFTFYQLQPEDFKCDKNEPSSSTPQDDESSEDSPQLNSKPFETGTPAPAGKIVQNTRVQKPRIKVINTHGIRKGALRQQQRIPLAPPTYEAETSGSEEYESVSDSQEIHDTASSNSEPVQKPVQTTESIARVPVSIRPIASEPTRKVLRPAVIKPFPGLRPKLQQQQPPQQPKVITTTTTSTSVTSTSASTAADIPENPPSPPSSTANSRPRAATTIAPQTSDITTTTPPSSPVPMQRFIPSESVPYRKPPASFDGPDFDDSKIPVITGVGPVRTISGTGTMGPVNNNNNIQPSIMQVRSSSLPPTLMQSHHPQPSQLAPAIAPANRPPNLLFADKSDILLKDVERQHDMVSLHWESHKNVPGFRIIYRIFGEDTFRHGPPLAAAEREYRIKNIPFDQCIVVCVVPYEDILYNEISPSAGSVPPGSQCKELKPNSPSALMTNMDKITIGASAAICATVLIAVFIFIYITQRSKNRRSNAGLITKVPPGSMMSPSPGPPTMVTAGSLNLMKEWDQLSAISARSIPRARVYHGNPMMEGNMASTHGTSRSLGTSAHQHQQQRSIPDGHSTHRSYLSAHHAHHNHSMHSYGHPSGHANGTVNNYLNNQSRLLRASMGSRSSQDALNKQLGPSGHVHRHFEQNQKRRRPGVQGRLSQSESLNTLSGYETPDNWTDHDMDVYVARNATRHDLVQL